ncbi:MAG: universal stress protein [Halobacteriaceae archaeon]
MTPGVDTVLVAVDGSEAAEMAADYAVAIAGAYDARLHVLYVLGEGFARGLEAGDLDSDTVATDNAAFVEAIREEGQAEGISVSASTAFGFSTTRKTQHPGSVTLDAAEEVAADFLVIPRSSDADTPGVLEKAAEYVLLYASQPTLSV